MKSNKAVFIWIGAKENIACWALAEWTRPHICRPHISLASLQILPSLCFLDEYSLTLNIVSSVAFWRLPIRGNCLATNFWRFGQCYQRLNDKSPESKHGHVTLFKHNESIPQSSVKQIKKDAMPPFCGFPTTTIYRALENRPCTCCTPLLPMGSWILVGYHLSISSRS